jgi:hypothetical protein
MNEVYTIIACIILVIGTFLFLRQIETYEDPKTKDIQQKLIRVDIRAAKISIKGSNQSFTEDKTRTYLCLRDENGQYYDDNMLMYVALHELAHAISESVDPNHETDEFKNNFKMLLTKAADIGVYDPKQPLNYNYCPKTKEIEQHNK